MQGLCHPMHCPTLGSPVPRSLLQAVITAQTHEFHEHSAPQGFSGSDFIWSETFKQDLAVFVYFFLCFLSYMELQSADDSLC